MKTINKYLGLGFAIAILMVGCKSNDPTREPATPEKNEIQAFIFANTTDVVIKPGNKDTVIISCGEGIFPSTEKSFPVLIGRKVTDVAASLPLIIVDEDQVFQLDKDVIEFAAQQVEDTVWVTTILDFGQNADLVIAIPEEYQTAYGTSTISINVNVDYTWLSYGSVTMSSTWEATTGTVAIEKAKEYTDAQGDSLFRLVSPYYVIAPEYCTEPGLHLNFLLDKDYQAVDLVGGKWIQVENTGYNWIYWETETYGDYNFFVSEANQYMISCLWSEGSGLYGPAVESFVWDKGYPGELVDPAEGDGVMDEIVFASASYVIDVDEYGYPLTVNEVLDETLYNADLDVFPESYIGHLHYFVTLTGVNGTMQLELVGDSLEGTYTFSTLSMDDNGYYLGKAGTAVPGQWLGTEAAGCFLQTGLSKYYLVDGSIEISATKTTIKAVSATGVELEASFNGQIMEDGGQGAARRKVGNL